MKVISGYLESKSFKNQQTYRRYEKLIKGLHDMAQVQDPQKLTQMDVNHYFEHYIKQQLRGELSPKTVESNHAILYNYLQYLFDQGLIQDNYMRHIPAPKYSRRVSDEHIIALEELDNLLSLIKHHYSLREYLLVMLPFTLGLSSQELVNLSIEDIVLKDDQGQIRVKRGGEYHLIDLHPDLLSKLKDHIRRLPMNTSYIFLNAREKGQLSARGYRFILSKLCEEAEIKTYAPKDLVNAGAIYALREAYDLGDISQELGISIEFAREKFGNIPTRNDKKSKKVRFENFSFK